MNRLRLHGGSLVRGGGDGRLGPRTRLALPALVFLSIALLVLSRINHTAIGELRARMASGLGPALAVLTAPLAPIRNAGRQIAEHAQAGEEIERLRSENQKLSGWEWRARELERKLADLERLVGAAPETRLDFATSRVIGDSSGAFARSVLIDIGAERNVRPGLPVINADGLVGRIVEAGALSARVMLATDSNSRIPVVIGESRVRAILAGDNGPSPKLIYIPQDAKIAAGDDVATSGAGGLYPRGLRIGRVAGNLAAPTVELRAKLDQLEYVSVLYYREAAATAPATGGGAIAEGPR